MAEILEEYGEFYFSGAIQRNKKPVHWCATCRTALAEAEVEYEEHKAPSVFVKFSLVSPPPQLPELGELNNVSLVIWTTTPWTLPANLAIAVHPDLDYALVRVGEEILVVAADLAAGFLAQMNLSGEVHHTVRGRKLEGLICRHPWLARDSQVILADYVTLEAGTGLVHIAPGHGQEDYVFGSRYGLPPYSPVDDGGRFTDEVPEFAGQKVEAANPGIIELLRQKGQAPEGGGDQPQLSPLLALQAAHHLPGHGAVVHLHGEKRPAAEGPGRHRSGHLDSPLGPGAHLPDGGAPPRLVHLPAALLGRAHRRLPLRAVRRGAAHAGDHGGHHRAGPAGRRGLLVRRTGCGVAAAGDQVRLRRRRLFARKRTSWTSGSTPG